MLAVTIAAVVVLLLCFNAFIVTLLPEMHEVLHVDDVIQKRHRRLHIFQLCSHLVSQLLAIGQLFAANVAHYTNQRPRA